MGKVWAIHTQTKKPKNQKTKKPKNQKTKNQKTKNNKKTKKTRPNTLHLTPSPWGVQSWFFLLFFVVFCCFLVFWFFGFLVFWFFGFLVCVWIAQTLPMGLNFLFFLFFFVFSRFWPNCKKPWKNQKTKKTKKQETKKPKNQKNQDCTPQGEGVRCRVLGLVFLFFFFVGFWFFGFLVWIAIADVPSRDCKALSVVALEARSIHYSTAMFAMT